MKYVTSDIDSGCEYTEEVFTSLERAVEYANGIWDGLDEDEKDKHLVQVTIEPDDYNEDSETSGNIVWENGEQVA